MYLRCIYVQGGPCSLSVFVSYMCVATTIYSHLRYRVNMTPSDDVFLNASTLSEPVGPVQLKCVVDGPRDVTLTEAQHQQRCANSTILVSCN